MHLLKRWLEQHDVRAVESTAECITHKPLREAMLQLHEALNEYKEVREFVHKTLHKESTNR